MVRRAFGVAAALLAWPPLAQAVAFARSWRLVAIEDAPESQYWVISGVRFFTSYVVTGHAIKCIDPLDMSYSTALSSGSAGVTVSPEEAVGIQQDQSADCFQRSRGIYEPGVVNSTVGWRSQRHSLAGEAWLGAAWGADVGVRCLWLHQGWSHAVPGTPDQAPGGWTAARRIKLQALVLQSTGYSQWQDVAEWGETATDVVASGAWLTLPVGLVSRGLDWADVNPSELTVPCVTSTMTTTTTTLPQLSAPAAVEEQVAWSSILAWTLVALIVASAAVLCVVRTRCRAKSRRVYAEVENEDHKTTRGPQHSDAGSVIGASTRAQPRFSADLLVEEYDEDDTTDEEVLTPTERSARHAEIDEALAGLQPRVAARSSSLLSIARAGSGGAAERRPSAAGPGSARGAAAGPRAPMGPARSRGSRGEAEAAEEEAEAEGEGVDMNRSVTGVAMDCMVTEF